MAENKKNFSKSDKLIKIRSKYIIIKIFENLKENKLFHIIHYNKKNQKLMNIRLKDYKDKFLNIVIEIKPEEYIYDKFINISNKNIKENIHIYFNDKKEEIKSEKINRNDNVTKIKIILNYKVKTLSKLFSCCQCIKEINFIKFNRDDIQNMSYMFSNCSYLKKINFSNFNTNNVTNMSGMFEYCSSLRKLDLSNFNTHNVIDMSLMFFGCYSLKELNLSNFNTSNVIYMHGMFSDCHSLKELDLSNFNTQKVKYLNNIFYGCYSLKELNLSNFNINKRTYIIDMFRCCSSLASLICPNDRIKIEYINLLELIYELKNNILN